MSKIILVLYFVAAAFLSAVFVDTVGAATSSLRQDAFGKLGAAAGASGANLGDATDPRTIAAKIIRTILGVVGTIFLVLTVYAGFLWMTAAGNDEQISKAKKLLYDGAIGLAVILSAYSITYFVSKVVLQDTSSSEGEYCIQNPLDVERCLQ